MEHQHTDTNRPWQIPFVIRIAGGGLLVVLLASIFFKVPAGTVVALSLLIALMFGGYLFSGGHGNHDSNYGQQSNPSSDTEDGTDTAQPAKHNQTNHIHGCH